MRRRSGRARRPELVKARRTTRALAATGMVFPAFTGSLSAPAPAVSTTVSHAAEYSSLGSVKSTVSSSALKYRMKLQVA